MFRTLLAVLAISLISLSASAQSPDGDKPIDGASLPVEPGGPQTEGFDEGGEEGQDPIHETYKRQRLREDLTPYGVDLLGERFDLATGTLSFYHTDIEIPGNNPLEVAVRREAATGRGHFYADSEFADWNLDIPRLEMVVLRDKPGWWADDRCTSESDPGFLYKWGIFVESYEYWNGLKMHIPGQAAQMVLDNAPSPIPANTPKTTTEYWAISCTNVGGSEGFIATSPDGIRYHFDKLRYLKARSITKSSKVFGRKRAQMLVTRVDDRFGNFVNYTYTGDNLTRIESSDGRVITITYGANDHVSTVTANSRTWTYGYTTVGLNDYLTSVTLPDTTSWSLDIRALVLADPPENPNGSPCWYDTPRETKTGTVTHPHGAKGTYTIVETVHGRADVPSYYNASAHPCDSATYIQTRFGAMSLTEKKLEGPGIPTMTWSYEYSENPGGFVGAGADPLKTTTVTHPDGDYDIYHFDRTWTYKEGALIKKEVFESDDTLVETTEYEYEPGPDRGSWGDVIYENVALQVFPRMVKKATVTRGTDVYYTEHDYDNNPVSSTFSFSYPTRTAQWNNLVAGHARSDDFAYLHDQTHWELGRRTTVHFDKGGANEELVSEYLYDANNRVQTVKQYGVEVREYSYNSDGTIAWLEDGANHRTTLATWKRGIPRLITYPDLTEFSFTVDDNGWIESSTDQKNYTTSYEFDSMGRLERIIYPTADGNPRLDKVLTLDEVTTANDGLSGSGIEVGQWKRVTTRGTFKSTVYLDALFNPVLTRLQDTTLGSSLDRFLRQDFDHNSRVTFASFPSSTAGATTGTDTSYDALGRITQAMENVTPLATTGFAYLNGNKLRITNPRGKQTTTTFFALGSPAQELPIKIEQPEGVTTDVVRNDFGEMTEATQSGGTPLVTATRKYYYDSRHNLCRQVDPETGSTAYSYNNDRELDWYAKAASGSQTACDLGSVPTGERIVRTHNNMGRLTNVNFPDTSPDLTYAYDDNGNLETLTSSDASWTYGYNAVNALDSEILVTGGQTFALAYGFDTQDRLTSVTYPGGTIVPITPNAYGEPESVGSYATSIDYWPNGSIEELQYGTQRGTGRQFNTTQNVRQLPENLRVVLGAATLANLTHSYDANANITGIDDAVNGTSYDRSMGYDDLDRLTSASGFWGAGSYGFDALGNILSKTESGIDLDYSYNATSNLLTSIDDTIGSADYAFSYDAYGNVTNNGSQGFTYNLAGQMTSSTSPSVSYKYDGHNRRVQKTEGGQTSYTVYSQSGWLMHKLNGGVSTHYIYAGSLLIAELEGANVHYLHTDLLGSPISGHDGTAYAEHYRPWGEKKDHPISIADDVGYTGHQNDLATGLTYMQARYFDPVVGRFLATDPVQFGGLNPGYFGRYLYVANNPVKFTDPTGRSVWTKLYKLARTGGDVGMTFAGMKEDWNTLTDPTASFGSHLVAGLSLASELLPVSGRDVKAGIDGVQSIRGASKVPNGRAVWGRADTLDDHFARHGADFGARSADDYAQQASNSLRTSQAERWPTKIDSDGVIRVYDPKTNTFGSYNADGTTRTFFKPDPARHGYPTNLDYWNAQRGVSP